MTENPTDQTDPNALIAGDVQHLLSQLRVRVTMIDGASHVGEIEQMHSSGIFLRTTKGRLLWLPAAKVMNAVTEGDQTIRADREQAVLKH